MGRYRKRPVVVDAMQWTGLNLEEVKDFVGEALTYDILDTAWEVGKGRPHVFMKIKTIEGDMEVSEKDFIIKGVNGEFYPCKPDIFQKTYTLESAEDKPIGRLIDADKYKHGLECAVTCTLHDERSQEILKAMLMVLDMQPTAYDPDKVVEQLEDEKEFAYADFNEYVNEVCPCLDAEYDDRFNEGLGRAIEIVKGGGVDGG